jgi:hypothetical protein
MRAEPGADPDPLVVKPGRRPGKGFPGNPDAVIGNRDAAVVLDPGLVIVPFVVNGLAGVVDEVQNTWFSRLGRPTSGSFP